MSFMINLNLVNNTKKVLLALTLASSGLFATSLINNAFANITMPLHSNSSINKEDIEDDDNAQAQDNNANAQVNANASAQPKDTQIKEKAKVYRDPFGNVIAAPIKKNEGKSTQSGTQANNLSEDNIKPTSSIGAKKSSLKENNSANNTLEQNPNAAKLNVAVVYFSVPENTKHSDVDVLSGASKVLTEDNQEEGTVEHLAKIICQNMKGELFELKNADDYPRDHQALITKTAYDKDTKARPQITLSPAFDPSGFDIIFVGYPIWWHDLPMPLYSFFKDFDLSGKTIIPFCTHGGNRPYKTFALIAHSEPNAQVISTNGLVVNRYKVPTRGEALVKKWLKKINDSVIATKYGHLQSVAHTSTKEQEQAQEDISQAKDNTQKAPN